jgi:hypothetical protein
VSLHNPTRPRRPSVHSGAGAHRGTAAVEEPPPCCHRLPPPPHHHQSAWLSASLPHRGEHLALTADMLGVKIEPVPGYPHAASRHVAAEGPGCADSLLAARGSLWPLGRFGRWAEPASRGLGPKLSLLLFRVLITSIFHFPF